MTLTCSSGANGVVGRRPSPDSTAKTFEGENRPFPLFMNLKSPLIPSVLLGTQLLQPEFFQDIDGTPATFFAFTDLAIRSSGNYILTFEFFLLPTRSLETAPARVQVSTSEFGVFSPRKFTGVGPVSELVRILKAQGMKIRLKNI